MRTPVKLAPQLLAQIRRIAAETDRSISDVIEEAIRESLARRAARHESGRHVRLPVYRGRGCLQPGVNLDDTASLLDIMGGRGAPR